MSLKQTKVNWRFGPVSDVVDVGIPRLWLAIVVGSLESRGGGLKRGANWPMNYEFSRSSFLSPWTSNITLHDLRKWQTPVQWPAPGFLSSAWSKICSERKASVVNLGFDRSMSKPFHFMINNHVNQTWSNPGLLWHALSFLACGSLLPILVDITYLFDVAELCLNISRLSEVV